MSTVNPTHSHDHHDDHHHGPVTLADGVWPWMKRWIGTTNHKDLGTLYLIFSFTMLFIGGLMSLVIAIAAGWGAATARRRAAERRSETRAGPRLRCQVGTISRCRCLRRTT